MISLTLKNIQNSQSDYLNLISQHKNLFEQKRISAREIAYMLDELKCFWLERLGSIEFELEQLANTKECFFLSGAIYLDLVNQEHFYFKTLGDYHFIDDPFMRQENFYRVPSDEIGSKETIEYTKRAYFDTIQTMTKYPLQFYFLPIRLIGIRDEAKHHELMETFSVRFIASIVQKTFSTKEEFFQHYNTYEEIEKSLAKDIKEDLKFTDTDERGLSLREKIERYCEIQLNCDKLTVGKSEPQIFWISIFSWVSQIVDILLVCVYLNVVPYIRFEVTFHYLVLLMHTFTEDKKLKNMIEKTIVFYLLRKTIDQEKFKDVDFRDYCRRLVGKSLLDRIIEDMRKQEIDICKKGVSNTQSIISCQFDLVMNTKD